MNVTAAISVLGMSLGKSRVCEVRHEVLCQIYARGEVELGHGLKSENNKEIIAFQ